MENKKVKTSGLVITVVVPFLYRLLLLCRLIWLLPSGFFAYWHPCLKRGSYTPSQESTASHLERCCSTCSSKYGACRGEHTWRLCQLLTSVPPDVGSLDTPSLCGRHRGRRSTWGYHALYYFLIKQNSGSRNYEQQTNEQQQTTRLYIPFAKKNLFRGERRLEEKINQSQF